MEQIRFYKNLPEQISEPYIYLSLAQKDIVIKLVGLKQYANDLPAWIPHRDIANALGHGEKGIKNAISNHDGKFYVWATEFENVHDFWNFKEPSFAVDNISYENSEDYFQRQKEPYIQRDQWGIQVSFNSDAWDCVRSIVMLQAIRYKFSQNEDLKQLLLSTGDHYLLSIKKDKIWGVHPDGEGLNYLAILLMEYRNELRKALPR